MAVDLKARLRTLYQQYDESIGKMLKQLNDSKLVSIHRTTLYRWLKDDTMPGVIAGLVVGILERGLLTGKVQRSLKVAQPQTDLALPSTLVCKPRSTKLRGTTSYADDIRLDLRYGIVCQLRDDLVNGTEALDLLANSEVDVAIAASILVHAAVLENRDTCLRLCTLSRAPLVAIALKGRFPKLQTTDFQKKLIGFPKSSALPELLDQFKDNEGLKFKTRGVSDWEDAAQLLTSEQRSERIDIFVAWDAGIRKVEEILKAKKIAISRLTGRRLGYLSQDVAVNIAVADASAVLDYFFCLESACRLLRKKSFRKSLGKQFGISIDPEFWEASSFAVRDVNVSVLERLRKGELAKLHQTYEEFHEPKHLASRAEGSP